MRQVTAEEVKAAVEAANLQEVTLRECSMCGGPLYYTFEPDGPYYHPACDCSPYSTYAPAERRTWQSIADLINMQSNPAAQEKIALLFGLKLSEAP